MTRFTYWCPNNCGKSVMFYGVLQEGFEKKSIYHCIRCAGFFRKNEVISKGKTRIPFPEDKRMYLKFRPCRAHFKNTNEWFEYRKKCICEKCGKMLEIGNEFTLREGKIVHRTCI